MSVKPMSRCQVIVLDQLSDLPSFPGYCELMLQTGITSYTAIDWVLDALARRGYVDPEKEYTLTPAGEAALKALKDEVAARHYQRAITGEDPKSRDALCAAIKGRPC